ncbi:hypothetical protein NSK_008173 [Nannochloropsis salina CCMP1776]|uniref:Uncharacterized protein n=1 Tax=Nannochloropsis salina CCMP1776 TaxID=1027361 RepID=A0A4D9CMT2_9STRA|nr:hypothetical protein NSK_008173 [Nannochloropsis salina CCMP1776]|eukprot:TFJ80432.1 hypothetical protein NSK_008173 [Nannochloropsis salina CCMP1776]
MALRRLISSSSASMRPTLAAAVTVRSAPAMRMSGKSSFDDKEHAMEDMYIRQAEEKILKKLLKKLKEDEKPACDTTAKKELEKIMGSVPEDLAKKLMDWKKSKH